MPLQQVVKLAAWHKADVSNSLAPSSCKEASTAYGGQEKCSLTNMLLGRHMQANGGTSQGSRAHADLNQNTADPPLTGGVSRPDPRRRVIIQPVCIISHRGRGLLTSGPVRGGGL
jgi:hypothetical protein